MPDKFSKFSSLLDTSLSGSWWNGEKRKNHPSHAIIAPAKEAAFRKNFYERALLSMHWREVVGKAAKFCCPLKVQDDILFVACQAPVWAQELALQQEAILEKLNSKLKNASLKKIVCIRGNSEIFKENETTIAKNAHEDQVLAGASPEEKARINKDSDNIEDTSLRNIIKLARSAQKQDEKWNKSHGIFICPECGRADKAGYCPACKRAGQQSRISGIFRALGTAPWLSYAEAAEIAPGATFEEYSQCRKQLMSRLWEDVWKHMAALIPGSPLPAELRSNIITLALMQAKITPDKVTQAILKGAFKAIELNTYYFLAHDAYPRLLRLMEKNPEKTKHMQLLRAYLDNKACEPAKPFTITPANKY